MFKLRLSLPERCSLQVLRPVGEEVMPDPYAFRHEDEGAELTVESLEAHFWRTAVVPVLLSDVNIELVEESHPFGADVAAEGVLQR